MNLPFCSKISIQLCNLLHFICCNKKDSRKKFIGKTYIIDKSKFNGIICEHPGLRYKIRGDNCV
jgi:hypothetical protein